MDASLQNFLYTLFLTLHNVTRWLVVVAAVWVLVRAYQGWLGRRAWQRSDDRAGVFFTSLMDTQLLLGLVLYFLFSPFSQQVFANFSEAMKNRFSAFFGVEHVSVMLVALIVAHVGRAISRKASEPRARHRTAAIWFSISVLLILAAIPWPFLAIGRPLLRIFGIVL
jgi:hypothetical protein